MADVLLELIGSSLLGYAAGAAMHIWIDYVHGKRLLRQYWDATDKKIAGIQSTVVTGVVEALPEIPVPDVSSGMETFLRSESGRTWANEVADLIVAKGTAIQTGQLGGLKRTDQRRIAAGLARIDWGNPWLNAGWQEVIRREPDRLNKIATQIMNSGMLEAPELASGELPEGVSNPDEPGWR